MVFKNLVASDKIFCIVLFVIENFVKLYKKLSEFDLIKPTVC